MNLGPGFRFLGFRIRGLGVGFEGVGYLTVASFIYILWVIPTHEGVIWTKL